MGLDTELAKINIVNDFFSRKYHFYSVSIVVSFVKYREQKLTINSCLGTQLTLFCVLLSIGCKRLMCKTDPCCLCNIIPNKRKLREEHT